MRTWVRAAAALCALALAASCGGADEGSNGQSAPTTAAGPVDETIDISMTDIAFKPTTLTVKAGTTVRFVFKNNGDLDHNAAFGDEATQQAVESGKQARDGIAASPNQTKAYTRRFDGPGSLIIGCHVAGHYEAGMKIRLTVA